MHEERDQKQAPITPSTADAGLGTVEFAVGRGGYEDDPHVVIASSEHVEQRGSITRTEQASVTSDSPTTGHHTADYLDTNGAASYGQRAIVPISLRGEGGDLDSGETTAQGWPARGVSIASTAPGTEMPRAAA